MLRRRKKHGAGLDARSGSAYDGVVGALARMAVLIKAFLGGAGSGLGIIAIRHRGFSKFRDWPAVSIRAFALLIPITLLASGRCQRK
jgi:hypothetical protein